jgi:serine/alanine adding enzyme
VKSLRIVDCENGDRWDKFIDSASGSTFCHQWGWNGIMRDVLGHEPIYRAAVDDVDVIHGVLPLVRVETILGHYLISLPFLNDGGPLGSDAAQRALVEAAVNEAHQSRAELVELRARSELPGSLLPTYRKVAVHLALPSSKEEFWSKTLRAKVRAQARRPAKEGMTFRCGATEGDAFYRVFAHNMRDLGTPVLPKTFFERTADAFGPSVLFAAVYSSQGSPVAGACSLLWKNELEVMWASSLREFNHLSPNMLLYSGLMEEAIDRDITVFNFGRCTEGSSTHRFKKQWGGVDVPLPWPSWSRSASAGVPTTDRAVYKVAVKAWSRLPLAVANRFGPRLARLLP